MRKFYFSLLLIISSGTIFAQVASDTLNKYNGKGQKEGYWLVYFTDTLVVTSEKSEAFYYGLIYYDNGYSIDGFFCSKASNYRKHVSRFVKPEELMKKGNPVVLNGIFEYYDGKGNLTSRETYKDGIPLLFENYYYDKNTRFTGRDFFDCSKKYKNQLSSWYYETYTADNKLKTKYYYGKNDKGKWKIMQEEKDK